MADRRMHSTPLRFSALPFVVHTLCHEEGDLPCTDPRVLLCLSCCKAEDQVWSVRSGNMTSIFAC